MEGNVSNFRSLTLSLFALVAALPAARVSADENVDLAMVHRIKKGAFKNGRVMDPLFSLTDVTAPRLPAPPGFQPAPAWAFRSLKGGETTPPRLETWGRFGRS